MWTAAALPQTAVDPALLQQARTILDGNPHLLEWLDRILQDKQTNHLSLRQLIHSQHQQLS